MYALFKKNEELKGVRYQFLEETSLFGCKSGYLPWFLKNQLSAAQSEPLKWHVNMERSFKNAGQNNQVLIINLKPNRKDRKISLYELMDVWGSSHNGWTPVMFHLRGLFSDEKPPQNKSFVFEILHLNV